MKVAGNTKFGFTLFEYFQSIIILQLIGFYVLLMRKHVLFKS